MRDAELSFWDAVDAIRGRGGRYRREAYGFVMGGLGATVQQLPAERLSDPERRHLSGGELVAGIVSLARREFGVMAPVVFREWGVLTGEDIGRIVFELVEAGHLSARPEDRLEDFLGAADLLEQLAGDLELGRGPARA
jgi:uncharacterized repeat protein (TIGR04138 family)